MSLGSNFEQCPHWRSDDADGEWCALLKQVTGVEEPGLCGVGEDVCRACCQSFPPSQRHLNPVVASQLCHLTAEIITNQCISPQQRRNEGSYGKC